jgi:hypothetical protein
MSAIQGDWYASRSTHDGESYPQSDDTVRFVYATQADGTKFIVAKVWSGDDGDYAGTAKLVAAAPELLSALQYMVENAEAEGWSCLMLSDAVAAIAKAEGRSDGEDRRVD